MSVSEAFDYLAIITAIVICAVFIIAALDKLDEKLNRRSKK